MKQHGTELDLSDLPTNIQAIEHDGNNRTWVEYIRRARLVVVPTLPSCIFAAGLGTYLVAMGLRKCVIITEGPQTRGLLRDEAIVIPPADPCALVEAIRLAWEDESLRERTANAGRRYAEKLGGENRLLSDIVDVCGTLVTSMHN